MNIKSIVSKILMFVVGTLLLLSSIVLFITYQRNIERENELFQLKNEIEEYVVKFKDIEKAMAFMKDALEVLGIEITIGRDNYKRASYTDKPVTTYTLTFKTTKSKVHILMYDLNDIENFWTNLSNPNTFYYIWDFPSIRDKYIEMRSDDEF